jgi:hypothetical protein
MKIMRQEPFDPFIDLLGCAIAEVKLGRDDALKARFHQFATGGK